MSRMYISQEPGIWNGVERDDWWWIKVTDGRETWDMGEPSETEEEAQEALEMLVEAYPQPAYVANTTGSRFRYVVLDSMDGTPFGMGQTKEEAIYHAGSGGADYYDDDAESWKVADHNWVAARLSDRTLEVLCADDLDEDATLKGL